MNIILSGGLIFTLLISNGVGFIRDGRRLDSLRNSVLRLHILADSNTEYAQSLKLKVRDGLLEADVFRNAATFTEAELTAAENLDIIEEKAEEILRENGCYLPVSAELADVVFDERVYEDITMPAGEYRALRVKIGSAQGKNWWCVMYPPLCLPAGTGVRTADAADWFDPTTLDILQTPDRYEVRFKIVEWWETINN